MTSTEKTFLSKYADRIYDIKKEISTLSHLIIIDKKISSATAINSNRDLKKAYSILCELQHYLENQIC